MRLSAARHSARTRTSRVIAAGASLALALVVLPAAGSAQAAEPPGDAPGGTFSTSFESSDAPALETRPYSDPVRIAGKVYGPGSLLGSVSAVTASAENGPGEPAAAVADAVSGTKWLAFQSTAWLQYQLSAPQTVKVYSLTSANDAPERDPKAWTLQGSADGTSWTTLDTRTGVDFADRGTTQTFTVATPGEYLYYRLDISANHSGGLLQLADWEILDGTTNPPAASPMITAVGTGPVSGPTIKPNVGFTGAKALRYVGSQTEDGDASGTNTLYEDLDVTIGADTELAYKVFPVLDSDLDYPATFVAVDLELADGTLMSATPDLTDQYGFGATAAAQGTQKALYANQWNSVRVNLGELAGKHVTKVLLTYHRPDGKAKARFSGWLDDVSLRPAAVVDPSSLTNFVDTRRGTNANSSFSRGNNIPAAAVPNGFNFYTPMTDAGSQSWLYSYASANNAQNRPTLNGIGISHEPSPWMGDRNQLAVMPSISTATNPDGSLSGRRLPFSHDAEIARPDLYQVAFDNGIEAAVAPADHSAVYRFTFPAGASVGSVILDQVDGSSKLSVDGSAVTGWVENGSGLSAGRTRMYVQAEFSRTPAAVVTTANRSTGRAVQFDTSSSSTVEMRIATSFISVAQAKANLDQEVTGKSFDQVRGAAQDAWDARLAVIDVPHATQTQKQTLYANLYRLNLYPNSQFEKTGKGAKGGFQYASPVSAPTGSATDTATNAKVVDGKIYVNNGFWDTYRTVWPAYSFLYPDVAKELVDGFVQQYRDGGWIARWSSPGYADLMTGTSSDASFAEAYVSGALPNELALEAYDAAVKNATVLPTSNAVGRKGLDTSPFLGYTSTATGESVSWGLEGYINDYAIGQMGARLAADPATPAARVTEIRNSSSYLLKRAEDYVNMFDPAVDFFQGKTPEGDFAKDPEDFDPTDWGGDYTETNGWNFAFHTPYDVSGLAALYGGTDKLVDKLDTFFSTPEKGSYGIHEAKEARDVRMGQFGMSNQVSHHIPYIYAAAGAPSGTQRTVREVLQRLFVGSEIGQGYPGDEDNGEMSSWYLFSALGFYPLSLASGQYTVGSPLFDKVVVDRRDHGTLTIDAPDNSAKNVYVSSLALDGTAIDVPTVEQSAILSGDHTLTFGMAATPQTWGSGHTTAQERTPYIDAAKPDFGSVAADDQTDLALLVDDNSRTSVALPAADANVTWTSTTGPVAVASYTLTNGASGAAPTAWTLQGSNDGRHWTTLDTRSGQKFAWATQTRSFPLETPSLYTRYRLHVTATTTGAPATLAEVELLDDTLVQGSDLEIYPSKPLTTTVGTEVKAAWAIVRGGPAATTEYDAQVDFLDGTGDHEATVSRAKLGGVQITLPHAFADPGTYPVRVTVTTTVDGNPVVVSGLTSVAVTRDATFVGAFDNACLTVPGVAANCDGNGYGLSKTLLAAQGFTQGETGTVPGTDLTFDLPTIPSGEPDNATAHGQRVRLNVGEGATQLSLVGTANESQQSGTAVITYSDGSTQDVPVTFGDWVGAASNPAPGSTVVAAIQGRLAGTSGSDNLKTAIFATTPVELKTGVTAEWLTLPDLDQPVGDGQLHFFAIATDGTRAAVAPLKATSLDVADQVAGVSKKLALATVSGGQPAGDYTATVNWGDQSPVDKVTVTDGTVRASHAFPAVGDYTVVVTADDGVTSAAARTTVHVEPSVYSPTLSVAPDAVAPGGTIGVAGAGFARGEQVEVAFASDPPVTRTVTASASGTISTSLTIPSDLLDGTYPITALGEKSRTVAEASVAVVRPVVTTKLRLAASASTIAVGSRVTLTATINEGASGAVQFFDGTTSLGMSPIVGGEAQLQTDGLAVGTHSLTARYVGDAGHTAAVSAAVTVKVTKVAVTLSAPSLSRTSKVYGSSTVVTVATTVTGATTGRVTFRNGSTVLGTAAIGKAGSHYAATLTLPRTLSAGRYASITASLPATATTAAAVSPTAPKVLTVSKAVPSSVSASGSAFARGTRPVVKVSVGKLTNGQWATGKVEIRVDGARVTTVRLASTSAHGKVTVTLPSRYSSSIRVKATYVPTDTRNLGPASSPTVTVKVKR
ncbi:GH92 family glycosyl hydrolase [Cellulomonas edaphi]|uniref:GH92 family glycosyl hydrolase n=1 Tax=Cellulomonas edaphi TaxID=3053468 RepID=A0ABT7S5V8_9CELL|nr:GH92 family glycosyl hydrolase [Cellulomons edaphi]MDM7831002.1 GH92 family glycosyl hydrolase [Cellulomons edaphi]